MQPKKHSTRRVGNDIRSSGGALWANSADAAAELDGYYETRRIRLNNSRSARSGLTSETGLRVVPTAVATG